MDLLLLSCTVTAGTVMVLVGYFTGAMSLIWGLPPWASLIFMLTQLLFGAAIERLSDWRRVKWRWTVYIMMFVIMVLGKNFTGAELAMKVLPLWRTLSFLASIYVFGFFLSIWIRGWDD